MTYDPPHIPLWAFFGGLANNLLRLFELLKKPRNERPDTFSDWLYVLQFVGVPIIGAVLAYAFEASGSSLNPLAAIYVGVSAPAIFKSLASGRPPIGRRNIG